MISGTGTDLVAVIKAFLSDIRVFSKVVVRRELRGYQLQPARAIVESVLQQHGHTFAVVMSRQAGKNELSAQIEAFLMNRFQQQRGATLVKASPTYKPQTVNSRLRLRDCLDNAWNRRWLHGDEGYMLRLGQCRALFFSAHPTANVVGATASVLLECDEAQDVDEDKWDKDFAPMGAATNVTTVFYGTVWSRRTLLARVLRVLRQQEAADGVQRVFFVPWTRVAEEVPGYGEYVRKELQRLGPDHPIIKTQYRLEEMDEAGRLFTEERLARMRGTHTRLRTPPDAVEVAEAGSSTLEGPPGAQPDATGRETDTLHNSRSVGPSDTQTLMLHCAQSAPCAAAPEQARLWQDDMHDALCSDKLYALTVDVAGAAPDGMALQDAALRQSQPRKDSSVVTVVRVCLDTLADPLLGLPRYEVVNRYWWTGLNQADLYARLLDLVRQWHAAYVVVDATGVGAGLAGFLARRFGLATLPGARTQGLRRGSNTSGRVLPVEFNLASKSDLGWDFLSVIETGRFKHYVDDGAGDTIQFWREVQACEFELLPGPGQRLRWGVSDPTLHDDALISAALCAMLDRLAWHVTWESTMLPPSEEAEGRF